MRFGVPHPSDVLSTLWLWEPLSTAPPSLSPGCHLPDLRFCPRCELLSGFPYPSLCWLLSRPLGGQAYLAHGGTQTPQPILPEVWARRGLTWHIHLVTTQLASPKTVLVSTYRPSVTIHSAVFCSQTILTWTIHDMIPQWTCPPRPVASQVLYIHTHAGDPSARAVGLLPPPLTSTEEKAKTWRYGQRTSPSSHNQKEEDLGCKPTFGGPQKPTPFLLVLPCPFFALARGRYGRRATWDEEGRSPLGECGLQVGSLVGRAGAYWDMKRGVRKRDQCEQSHSQRDPCCGNSNCMSGVKAAESGVGRGESEQVTESIGSR